MNAEHRQDSEHQASSARQLWAGGFVGVLSTHSLDLPGYPFGSVVPYCLGADGAPLFLLSHLSQHTKNLAADGRCSLTVSARGEGDVQQLARIVAIGDVEPLPTERGQRYLRYFPQSEFYLRELNFRFYRLEPRRFHFNNGFATARWFGIDRIVRANPLAADEETAILDHMNQDHQQALQSYFRQTGVSLELADDSIISLVGMDAEGIDLLQGERLRRLALPRPISDRQAARELLIEMASRE